jgi:predicted enzyme related to lactoylglutathione lyase
MLVLWVAIALAHCIQLDDGSNGAPKTWGTAERIDWGTNPEVAIDPAGDAVAVWYEPGGVFSCRYTPTDGWGEVVWIGAEAEGKAAVAIDADGAALAAWSFSWVETEIVSRESKASGEWDQQQTISDGGGEAFNPQISMGADGSAMAVWQESDGTEYGIWSNRYTRLDGWRTYAEPTETGIGHAINPQVAVDPQGNAVAVWEQASGTRLDIWSNRYMPSAGWGAAQRIETEDEGFALSPQVAVDAQGNAVAVWEQSDGTRLDIWSNCYTPSNGWGSAGRIETEEGGDASRPHVAVDARGNAIAVWEQFDGTRYGIWSNRYTPSRGWGTAEPITPNDATDALEPRVAVDPRGNAVSVWRQSGTTGDGIWSNRYTPSVGWGSAQRIDSDHTGARGAPRVAIDANGNAIAVWSMSGGSGDGVWSNRLE